MRQYKPWNLIMVWAGLTVGSIVYHYIVNNSWEIVFRESWAQASALLCVFWFISRRVRP